MNSLTSEMKEEQEKQRKEKLELIKKFQEKLKFSVVSLVFFIILTGYTLFVPIIFIGAILPILFGATSIIFIQQIIRSYNYLEFYKNNYSFMESVYNIVEHGNEIEQKKEQLN